MKKLISLLIISLTFCLSGCVTTSETPVYVSRSVIDNFTPNTTSKSEVEQALGKPNDTDLNPDGRSVYLYFTSKRNISLLVFDRNDVLMKVVNYEK